MSDYSKVADTIRKQLGVFGLGVVGASNLAFAKGSGYGALTFKARLHYKGQSRARVMRVFVCLNSNDLYDVEVVGPNDDNHLVETNLFANQLTEAMYRLDAQGVEK